MDGEPDILERKSSAGVDYQFEMQAFWDDQRDGPIRVLVAIDGPGLPSFSPITDDFIIAPDGTFVGEKDA